MISQEFSFK